MTVEALREAIAWGEYLRMEGPWTWLQIDRDAMAELRRELMQREEEKRQADGVLQHERG